MPAVLPSNVLSVMFAVASLSIAPPPGPLFLLNVSPLTLFVPNALTRPPPPNKVAVLPVNVLFVTLVADG